LRGKGKKGVKNGEKIIHLKKGEKKSYCRFNFG